jgi:quercetin dioxygenase-like cupin family protein
MLHHPADARAELSASPDWFTGRVRIEPVIDAEAPGRARSVTVSFQPGARTAWHTHPLGQTLFILSGQGWAQSWGGPVVVLNPGDAVWFAPGEKHWHGATPTTPMAHLAVHEAADGRTVDWLEQVAKAEYRNDDQA